MATEPFLINPPKRLRRRRKSSKAVGGRRRRKNTVGETLIMIGANPMKKNPWYGDSSGHRIAALMRWGKLPRGKVKRHRKRSRVVRRIVRHRTARRVVRRKRGRWAPKHIRIRRKIEQQAFWTSKYGHMLAHPRSKKVYTRKGFVIMATKRRRSRKRNTWFGQPRRHRKAARKGWRRGHLLGGKRRRRRVRHNAPDAMVNPRRRRHYRSKARRHHARGRRRRNPAIMAEFGKFSSSVMNVREWGPLALTGGVSAITGSVAPNMLGVFNPWARLGVQTAVAIGGSIVVERFIGSKHGQAWMIAGLSMVGYQLLKQFVLQPYLPQFAVGLGNSYQDYYPDSQYANGNEVSQQVGAFPGEMSAFPSLSGYPGVGGEEVGAYPYDGSGY